MKKSELQQLISECIAEVLAEDKKTLAINEIKRIIAENELGEAELEEIFWKENTEGKAKLEKQYDELAPKATKKPSKADALARAKKEDNYKGEFVIDRGVMQYHSKSSNPIQGKTGGSSGFGTANK
jgi:hypothetical protein